MLYRVEVFPHYQQESIVSYTEDILTLQMGINTVYLEEGKPSYINVRYATEEEIQYNRESTRLNRVEVYNRY
jgi:hypothetical protein